MLPPLLALDVLLLVAYTASISITNTTPNTSCHAHRAVRTDCVQAGLLTEAEPGGSVSDGASARFQRARGMLQRGRLVVSNGSGRWQSVRGIARRNGASQTSQRLKNEGQIRTESTSELESRGFAGVDAALLLKYAC